MYGPYFQSSESLKAMAYFEDGDLHTLTQTEKSCLVKTATEVRDLPQAAILAQPLTAACVVGNHADG